MSDFKTLIEMLDQVRIDLYSGGNVQDISDRLTDLNLEICKAFDDFEKQMRRVEHTAVVNTYSQAAELVMWEMDAIMLRDKVQKLQVDNKQC
jgi:hypothetical protein